MGTEALLPGGKSPSTSASRAGEAFAGELQEQSRPVRQELFDQILEGLQTGGIEARIPVIQRAVEQSQQGTSQSLRQIDESLATSGLNGTPFGERTRAEAILGGGQAASRIPTDIVRDFLSIAPGYVSNTGQQATAGFGSAGASQAAVRSAQIAAVAQIVSQALESGQKAYAGS